MSSYQYVFIVSLWIVATMFAMVVGLGKYAGEWLGGICRGFIWLVVSRNMSLVGTDWMLSACYLMRSVWNRATENRCVGAIINICVFVCEVGWLFVGYVWVWWGGAYHPPHTLAIHFIFCQRSLLPVDCVDFVFYTLRAHMWARIVRLISAETIMCTVISVRSGLVNTSRPAHFSRICHLPSTRCLGDCDKSNQFHTVPLNVTFLLDFSCIISNVWVWMLIGETWCLLEQLVFYI